METSGNKDTELLSNNLEHSGKTVAEFSQIATGIVGQGAKELDFNLPSKFRILGYRYEPEGTDTI